jgi:uncharacterized protein (TIGR02452 family)
MSHSKSKAAEVARDTIEVVTSGRYTTRRGKKVAVRHLVEAAMNGTVSYPPDAPLPTVVAAGRPTAFEVVNDTTLAAARRLVADGFAPAALNFASARHPGGGFLNGARAQEESLCRASALYYCINGNAMYRHHAHADAYYSNYALYSPAVPVFKGDDGEPLDEPYACAFVTSPAVNAGALRAADRDPDRVRKEMEQRVEKVLAVMAGHGHDAAVLGAWGCGVFENDPEMVADLFARALRGRFAGCFVKVVFAVLSPDGETIGPFEERFHNDE